MAVQDQLSLPNNRHIPAFDESEAIKGIIDSTDVHPIDDFITELAEKEWDLSSAGAMDLDLASLPAISDVPPTNDKGTAVLPPSTPVSSTTLPSQRPTHKRSVTLDESLLPAAATEASSTTLTAEDFNIVAASLIDIEPTPVSELMKEDPIPLYIPPSPATTTVLAPSPPPTMTLLTERPPVAAAPSSTVICAQVPPATSFAPSVPASKAPALATGARPLPLRPIALAPRQIHPVYSRAVPPKPVVKAKRVRSKKNAPVLQYVEPTCLDCLLGRGGKSNHHPGNKRYRAEVQNLQRWYKSSGKSEKTDLSQCLVNYVHNYGGRFLRQEKSTGRWYVVSNLVARRKASQALREHLSPEERAAKKAQLLKQSKRA